jgi:hypothetical protein
VGEDHAQSSLLGQGATFLKNVLDGRDEEQSAESDALLREVLARLASVETRLDTISATKEESTTP